MKKLLALALALCMIFALAACGGGGTSAAPAASGPFKPDGPVTLIVAYKAGAVPDTLGDGGLLLEEKEPYTVAAAVNRVVKDEGLRNDIVKAQERILGEMSYESVKKIFLKCFENIIQN